MSWTKFRKLACYLCNLTIWIGIIGFYLVKLLLWPVFTVADPGGGSKGGGGGGVSGGSGPSLRFHGKSSCPWKITVIC